MKELSIEEKAKAYDEIIERLKDFQFEYRFSTFSDIISDKFPELKESEGEKIRKEIIKFIDGDYTQRWITDETKESWIAWLEKQAEHANFRNKIQVGDKVTRNEDGVLVNLSQLNRVAKKQGEQILANSCKTCKDEQKTAWSEEDETTRNNISHIIRQYDKISKRNNQPCWYVGDCLLWIQNIKDRVQPQREWKPSEEQMKALHDLNLTGGISYAGQGQTLIELYNDLKKL